MSLVAGLFLCCRTGNKESTIQGNAKLKDMIENKSFEIISKRAHPIMTSAMQQLGNAGLFVNGSTAGSIDISTHSNILWMKNDSVKANLPFYGERQFGGGYNNASGIEFEGIPKNLRINKVKAAYNIHFEIHDANSNIENYQVHIKLSPNLTSTITVRSSSRSSIQFTGNVHAMSL